MAEKDSRTIRISRKNALGMDELIHQYILEMKLASGLDRQLIFGAWDKVSGAANYTGGKFFKDGVLHVKINSSMVRSQLLLMKKDILSRLNDELLKDELFSGYGNDAPPVKDIALR
ncbi:MAG: DUF721 domain-containing protein [Bacteroidales bacterium]|jgi:hypothetical protein|nr:DUF721 domain-containing protein [Bacteroidales bacterium]